MTIQYRIKITLLLLFILTLCIFHVFILNIDSTEGDALTFLSKDISELETYNMDLAATAASASSIVTISQKAQQYGMVRSTQVVSLIAPLPLAYTDKSNL